MSDDIDKLVADYLRSQKRPHAPSLNPNDGNFLRKFETTSDSKSQVSKNPGRLTS
jgi:hypothetical protein